MKQDDTVDKILNKIVSNIKKQFGVDFSIEDVHEIVDFQFHEVAKAITEQKDIRLPYFGAFIQNKKRVQHIEKHVAAKEAKASKFNITKSLIN